MIRNGTLFITSPQDMEAYDAACVKNVFFSHKYSGSVETDFILNLLSPVKRVNKLAFNVQISWELASKLNVFHPKELYFTVSLNEDPPKLDFPELRSLEIYANGADKEVTLFNSHLLHSIRYDFSGVPNVTRLNLHWWEHLDYSSIAQLRKLETLVIHDYTLFDLYWLSPTYRLKWFGCFAQLDDITAISIQSHLEHIDFNRNRIADASPLLHLTGIKYLDLYMNPLLSEDDLRKMDIETLIISWDEYEAYRASQSEKRRYLLGSETSSLRVKI